MKRAIRCPDPFIEVRKGWVVRRLAPYCSRIELAVLPRQRDELKLLSSMAYETGNIHLGTRNAHKPILRHLARAKTGWLLAAAQAMVKQTAQDWREWRSAV